MLFRSASFALITALAAAPTLAIADPAPVASQVETTTAPVQSTSTTDGDYAKRETTDRAVENYRGGSTVVIAMSGGALIVLLLLLLLL